MRYSICIPCFFGDMDFCDALRRIRSLGFDAAETWNWPGLDLDRVHATCEGEGMSLVGFCTTDFRLTDPARRDGWLHALEASARAAVRAGATNLITQPGPDTGAPREAQRDSIAAGLRAARDILGEQGVTLLLEPLNTRFDHPDAFFLRSEDAFGVVREVGDPHVRVLYDAYHQQISEGNLIPTIRDNLAWIGHFHGAGHPGRHDLPLGETNYAAVFRAIDEAGYAGCFGLEYFPLGDPEESLRGFRRLYLGKDAESTSRDPAS